MASEFSLGTRSLVTFNWYFSCVHLQHETFVVGVFVWERLKILVRELPPLRNCIFEFPVGIHLRWNLILELPIRNFSVGIFARVVIFPSGASV